MTWADIFMVATWALAGVAEGAQDYLDFIKGDKKRTNPPWWSSPHESWRRKYHAGSVDEGPKFPGSTTIFVMFTDAWHFFQFLSRRCPITVTIYAAVFLDVTPWLLLAIPANLLGFNICWRLLRNYTP